MTYISSNSYTQIASKNIGSTGYGQIQLKIYAKLNSQSLANNTSTVGTKLTVKVTTGTAYSQGCSYSLTGATSKSNQTLNMTTSEKTLLTGTYTFTHTDTGTSGTKTISSSYNIYGYKSSFSGTITTPDIPRKATVTSAPNFTDEDNPTITYSNKAGNSVTTLQASIYLPDGITMLAPYRDISKTGTSYTFELTNEERDRLRQNCITANSRAVRFYIRTVIGGNNYTHNLEKTLTIVNADPTISTTIEETNQDVINLLGSSTTSAIKNISQIQVTATPTTLKSATVSNVKFTNGTITITDTDTPYQTTIRPVDSSIISTVTDSRGNTAQDTKTFTLIDYEKITFNSFSFKRLNPTSSDIRLDADIKYYQQTFGSTPNTPTVRWGITQNDTTTWTTLVKDTDYTVDTENNKISVYTTLNDALVYTEQAIFTLEVSDLLSSFSDNKSVGVGIPTFEAGEHDFQVNGDLYLADTTRQNPINMRVLLTDYIIEQGTDDFWTYRKWASGLAECWGNKSFTGLVINTATANHYYGDSVNVDLPTNLFTSVDYATMSNGNGSRASGMFPYQAVPINDSYLEVQFRAFTGGSGGRNCPAYFHVYGRWE